MPKILYFSNKSSKIAKRWGLPTLINLRFWWPKVIWPNFVFSSWSWQN